MKLLSFFFFYLSLFLKLLAFALLKANLPVISLSLLQSYYTSSVNFGLLQGAQVAHSPGVCRIGSSMAGWHRAEAPKWIASGVILTCSLTVKSQMFWFILSPLSICLALFSATEGFSAEGLVKVGPVYGVHAGRKWCHGFSTFTWQHGSKTHLWAHSHRVIHKSCTLYTSVHLHPVISSINDSTLWVNISGFLYYVIKAA